MSHNKKTQVSVEKSKKVKFVFTAEPPYRKKIEFDEEDLDEAYNALADEVCGKKTPRKKIFDYTDDDESISDGFDPDDDIEMQTASTFKKAYQDLMQRGQSFWGSTCVLNDPALSMQMKILLFLISSLSYQQGFCFAHNSTLADKLGVSVATIKRHLNELEKEDFIRRVNVGAGRRRIYLQFKKMEERYKNLLKFK